MKLYFQMMSTLIYHIPQVYENLTDFILDHTDNVSFQDLGNFIAVISQARYTPSRMDELSQCCHDKLVTSFDDADSDIVAQMQYIYHLCCLQICPDSLLTHVFTVDYLEKVDKLFEGLFTEIVFLIYMFTVNYTDILLAYCLQVWWTFF